MTTCQIPSAARCDVDCALHRLRTSVEAMWGIWRTMKPDANQEGLTEMFSCVIRCADQALGEAERARDAMFGEDAAE